MSSLQAQGFQPGSTTGRCAPLLGGRLQPGWIPSADVFIRWKRLPKRYPPESCTLCSTATASLQRHCSIAAASPQRYCSITTTSPQHHCSSTATSPQHHCNVTAMSLQHHRNVTAAPPQGHRSGSVHAPGVSSPSEEHVAPTSVIFLLLDLSPLYKYTLYVFIYKYMLRLYFAYQNAV